MTATRKFKSDAFEAIHSAVAGMERASTTDKATMRDFDETCLAITPAIAPAAIKQLRADRGLRQRAPKGRSPPSRRGGGAVRF
jgi:putative transcriptional regulator